MQTTKNNRDRSVFTGSRNGLRFRIYKSFFGNDILLVKCTSCGEEIEPEQNDFGRVIECPVCNDTFYLHSRTEFLYETAQFKSAESKINDSSNFVSSHNKYLIVLDCFFKGIAIMAWLPLLPIIALIKLICRNADWVLSNFICIIIVTFVAGFILLATNGAFGGTGIILLVMLLLILDPPGKNHN
jgi:DNA-directed RNA polymerase subunit RPC12/RpoP